jgi:hypothetical protein
MDARRHQQDRVEISRRRQVRDQFLREVGGNLRRLRQRISRARDDRHLLGDLRWTERTLERQELSWRQYHVPRLRLESGERESDRVGAGG